MYFAPELFFADTSTLSCFHRIEIDNNSILAELSPLGAFFPDLIFIGFQPVIPCISDKSCYAIEILCDLSARSQSGFQMCFIFEEK